MVNTAQQGARFERKVIHDLEPYGYDCIRSAASKGAVDIVAVAPGHDDAECEGLFCAPGARTLFIQCKLSNPMISPKERRALWDLAQRAGALPIICHWAKSETTGLMAVHYRIMTGTEAREWLPWEPGEDD